MTKQDKKLKPPDEIDYLIAQVVLEDHTITDEYIADTVLKGKYTRQAINKRRNSPQVQGMIQDVVKTVKDYIVQKKLKAIRKIAKHIDSMNEAISLRASEDMVKPELNTIEVEGETLHVNFTFPKRKGTNE